MITLYQDYKAAQKAKRRRGGLNLPAMARRHTEFMGCIQPPPGKVFVSQDVVSLEPTITAEMSGDTMYKYATMTGIGQKPYYSRDILMISDIYLMSGSVFPVTKEPLKQLVTEEFRDLWLIDDEKCKEITKKTVRNFSKTACLGMGYGMGAKKFQRTAEESGVKLTYKEAKATVEAYWDLFSGLKALRDTLSWQVKRTGAVVNPFGYRCTPEPHKALNAYIQSTASGVLDLYCLHLFNSPWMEFIALIHDEVILMVPEDRVEEFRRLSEEAVRDLNNNLSWECPIRFETKIAKSFAELK